MTYRFKGHVYSLKFNTVNGPTSCPVFLFPPVFQSSAWHDNLVGSQIGCWLVRCLNSWLDVSLVRCSSGSLVHTVERSWRWSGTVVALFWAACSCSSKTALSIILACPALAILASISPFLSSALLTLLLGYANLQTSSSACSPRRICSSRLAWTLILFVFIALISRPVVSDMARRSRFFD